MVPLHTFAAGVLAEVIRRQPDSPERTRFAWQVAVGAPLARATTVELVDRVLVVRPRDPRWATEIVRASDVILKRVQHLLGAATVARIEVKRQDGWTPGT